MQPKLTAINHQRLDLLSTVDQLNALGQVVKKELEKQTSTRLDIEVLQSSEPALARSNSRETTLAFMMLLIIPVAYLTDLLLFGELGEFIASELLGTSPVLLLVGRLMTPALIVALEMVLAVRIHSALHAHVTAPSTSWEKATWVGLGLIMCIVMPLSAYATFQQLNFVGGRWAPLLLLIILALVAHVPIVFGGTRALDAKSLMLFKIRQRRHSRALAHYEAVADEAIQEIRRTFPTYLHRIATHNAAFQPPVPFGPFDAETWTVIQELFPGNPGQSDLHSQSLWFRGIHLEQAAPPPTTDGASPS